MRILCATPTPVITTVQLSTITCAFGKCGCRFPKDFLTSIPRSRQTDPEFASGGVTSRHCYRRSRGVTAGLGVHTITYSNDDLDRYCALLAT